MMRPLISSSLQIRKVLSWTSTRSRVGFVPSWPQSMRRLQKKLVKEKGPALAAVDQDTGAEVMKKFGIERFPTVMWFWQGKQVLELPRASEKTADKLVEWAHWAAGAAVQELDTKEEFDGALSTLRSSLHAKARLMVLFKGGSEGLLEAFEEAAQRQRTTTVFLYIKESLADGTELHSYGGDESKDEVYSGASTTEAVGQWVKEVLEKAKPPKTEEAEKAEEPATDGKE